ncbi:MAG TPA: flagellar hook-basal body complex protein FliE [Longimicrobiaceae bacterium]
MSVPISGAVRRAAQAAFEARGIGAAAAPGAAPGGASFGDTLKNALGQVSAAQDNAGATVGAFLRGEAVEMHQVMAAGEEAGIALEMLIEVRNKFLEAYRTVVNMQS